MWIGVDKVAKVVDDVDDVVYFVIFLMERLCDLAILLLYP